MVAACEDCVCEGCVGEVDLTVTGAGAVAGPGAVALGLADRVQMALLG